ncbi:hypothetical protein [Microcoleus sp. T3_D1]
MGSSPLNINSHSERVLENAWRYYDRHHQEIDRLIVAHQTDD